MGTLKINVRYEPMNLPSIAKENGGNEDDDLEGGIHSMARKGRVLMRTDGVHRVILNSPVFKEMNVGTKDGEEPSGRTMMLTGMEDSKPRGFQIRVSSSNTSSTCTDRDRSAKKMSSKTFITKFRSSRPKYKGWTVASSLSRLYCISRCQTTM